MRWVRFGTGLAAASVLASATFLFFFALLPVAWGWSPVVVLSGSMSPAIESGDVVVTAPPSREHLVPGVVARFESPVQTKTLLHRVIEVAPDGMLRTQGDANVDADSTPVHARQVTGVARLVIPLIGYPALLVEQSQPLYLGGLAAATVLLVWMSRWGLLERFEPWQTASPARPPLLIPFRERTTEARYGRAAAIAAILIVGTTAFTASSIATGFATFAASSGNAGSSLVAGNFHVEFDAASSKSGNRVTSLSWSHTTGTRANRLLVVGVSTDANHPATSVTYGGNALTFLGGQTDGGNKTRVELWYRVAPASGTANVVVTFASQTNDDVVAGATSWRAVHQSTPLGTPVFKTGNSTTASATVTSAVGEYVVDVASADSETLSVGAGQAQHWNVHLDKVGAAGSSEAGATSVTMSWGLGNNRAWAIGAVPIRQANP